MDSLCFKGRKGRTLVKEVGLGRAEGRGPPRRPRRNWYDSTTFDMD